MILDEKLRTKLEKAYQEMYDAGGLLSRDRLARCYATFRARFGPEQLQSLDGEALLEMMHDSSNQDSLVYWLEYKNDDEFPARFGSIGGGSALKFGIYRRKETGVWMGGIPQKQKELSLDEAIEIARRNRDQLVHGAELLERLPLGGGDEDYARLQQDLMRVAPDVADTSWGHKYFYLLYPDKLEDYHALNHQRFYLIKLLQSPPEGPGRYLAASQYLAIARELGIHVHHLTDVLGDVYGHPHRYWRIGTRLDEKNSDWELFRAENCVAVGWPEIGDLGHITYDRESKEQVREAIRAHYPSTPQAVGKSTQQLFNFVATIGESDLVLAADGRRILGVGKVTGPYLYNPDSKAHHRLPVEWLSVEEWEQPVREGLLTTVHEIKQIINQIEAERRVLYAPPVPSPSKPRRERDETPRVPIRLTGIPGRIQSVLERKKQAILHGPPGTGKTYWARRAALDLAAHARFGRLFAELSADEQHLLIHGGDGAPALVRMCTFHPAYGYEDFIEGYRPQESRGQLAFHCQDGILKTLCHDASQQPQWKYYLVIDEINRGDIPRIFGELITLLEKDKRGQSVLLPFSGEAFHVPDNVYLIGTMNTADRSIALLDTALRRRFGFVELMPDPAVLGAAVVENSIPLGPWLAALNERILEHIGRDARNLQIGHAYLLDSGQPVVDMNRFARVVQDDIVPLLQEYCYEDYDALAKILGSALVDVHRQRIRHELFDPDRRDLLVQALLAPAPDIAASAPAIAAEQEELDREAEEDEEEEGAG